MENFVEEGCLVKMTPLELCVVVQFGAALQVNLFSFLFAYYLTILVVILLYHSVVEIFLTMEASKTVLPLFVTIRIYLVGC